MVAVNVLAMRELKIVLTEAGRAQKGREEIVEHFWYWRMLETKTNQPNIQRIHIDVRSEDSEDAPVIYELDGFVHAGK